MHTFPMDVHVKGEDAAENRIARKRSSMLDENGQNRHAEHHHRHVIVSQVDSSKTSRAAMPAVNGMIVD